MLSQIIVYLSLLCQVIATGYAISLIKKTKYNVAWIMFSSGFFLIAIYRAFELFPLAGPIAEETLYVAKVWISLIISLVIALGIFYIRKLFQYLQKMEKLRDETEKRVLSAVIRTEEVERQRFAKELHDGIGPLLSVAKMLLSGLDASRKDSNDNLDRQLKHNLQQVVDEAIASVREISTNISPHVLNDFGLKEAISSFIKKLRAAEAIDVQFNTNIERRRFSYSVEVIMYRVICELINNTIRHANADAIHLELHWEKDALYLHYRDNGRGFDPPRTSAHGGMGIRNMQYRLRSGNGDIHITSAPGHGMEAQAYIHAK
jgi:signal transduction histidine kinase